MQNWLIDLTFVLIGWPADPKSPVVEALTASSAGIGELAAMKRSARRGAVGVGMRDRLYGGLREDKLTYFGATMKRTVTLWLSIATLLAVSTAAIGWGGGGESDPDPSPSTDRCSDCDNPGRTFVVYQFTGNVSGVTYTYIGKASAPGRNLSFSEVMRKRYTRSGESGWRKNRDFTPDGTAVVYTSRTRLWYEVSPVDYGASTGKVAHRSLCAEHDTVAAARRVAAALGKKAKIVTQSTSCNRDKARANDPPRRCDSSCNSDGGGNGGDNDPNSGDDHDSDGGTESRFTCTAPNGRSASFIDNANGRQQCEQFKRDNPAECEFFPGTQEWEDNCHSE